MSNTVQYLSPDTLPRNPAFSNVVVVPPGATLVFVGGQNAVDASGAIIGKGDIAAQTEQSLANLEAALQAGGASLEQVIKWTIYLVQGQPLQPGFEAFQRRWGQRPNPPAISGVFVAGLANPDYLVEIEGVAAIL